MALDSRSWNRHTLDSITLLFVAPPRMAWAVLKVVGRIKNIQVGDNVEVAMSDGPRLGVVTEVFNDRRRVTVVSADPSHPWTSSTPIISVRKAQLEA